MIEYVKAAALLKNAPAHGDFWSFRVES